MPTNPSPSVVICTLMKKGILSYFTSSVKDSKKFFRSCGRLTHEDSICSYVEAHNPLAIENVHPENDDINQLQEQQVKNEDLEEVVENEEQKNLEGE